MYLDGCQKERINNAMRIVHNQLDNQSKETPKKKVPLYKDKAAIAAGVRQFIIDNNERLDRLEAKKNKT